LFEAIGVPWHGADDYLSDEISRAGKFRTRASRCRPKTPESENAPRLRNHDGGQPGKGTGPISLAGALQKALALAQPVAAWLTSKSSFFPGARSKDKRKSASDCPGIQEKGWYADSWAFTSIRRSGITCVVPQDRAATRGYETGSARVLPPVVFLAFLVRQRVTRHNVERIW